MVNTEKTYSTSHLNTSDYRDATMRQIYEITKGTGKFRLIKVGAGFVILPETNTRQDIKETELRKALHIEEKAPKEEKITNYKIEDSDSWSDNAFFVSLTEEQVRLLDWLINHDYVDCDLFSANPNIEFEKI